jgi:hypothetical protein
MNGKLPLVFTKSVAREQINSNDYSYLVRDYPSNHVESIGYRLRKYLDFIPYKYKGYGRLRTLKHIPIEYIYFIYIFCPRSKCNVASFSCSLLHIHLHPYSNLRRLDPSLMASRPQDDPRILSLLRDKIYFVYFTKDLFCRIDLLIPRRLYVV